MERGLPIYLTWHASVPWHATCSSRSGEVLPSMRQTPVRNLLFASALVVGLLAAFPSASSSGPTTQVNVGGIDFKANDGGGSFTSGKVRERSQPVNTRSEERRVGKG